MRWGHGGAPAGRYGRYDLLWTAGSRPHGPHRWALILLAALLVVGLWAPPPILAQDRGGVPIKPTVPRTPDGAKPWDADLPSGPVHVMIELDDEPAVVASARAGSGGRLSVSAARSQVSRLEGAQQTVLRALSSGGVNPRVIYRLKKSYNGIAAVVDASAIGRIRSQAGVKAVHRIQHLERTNTSSVPLVNAPSAWTSTGFTGQNVKVGIIDSGIDYLHANFGGNGDYAGKDPKIVEDTPGFFPNGPAIVDGFDFAGDAYDSSGANNIPQPDPDPIDCPVSAGGGHGTHVAGTAAGRGVNADGSTFAGPYDASVPFASLRIGPGVAPQAKLYALKVFGCTGTTVLVPQAIEWALDPNDDDDFSDRLDVVNLSLGSSFTVPEDGSSMAAENAAIAGLVVVGAAGNAGDTTGIAGGPSSAPRAISVAGSDDGAAVLDAFQVTAPVGIVGTYVADAAANFDWDSLDTPLDGQLAYPDGNRSGCDAFGGADAAAIVGKVALLDWIPAGSSSSPCGSAQRVANAASAGAIGVLLVYNMSTLDITIAGAASIPSMVTISTIGDLLKLNLESDVSVRFDRELIASVKLTNPSLVDQVYVSSSRGPKARTGLLKPDVSAPAVTIFSAESGSGAHGQTLTGTSMAAPHVTGLVALLHELHPSWTVEEIKALIVNTAHHDVFAGPNQSGNRLATSRGGAGRVDAATATTANSIAFTTDTPGTVGVSFGAVDSLGETALERTVRVVNKSGDSLTYAIGYAPTTTVPGTAISFPDGADLSLGAGDTGTFRVRLSMNAAEMKHPRDPTMAETQAGNPREYLAEVTGLVTVTPSAGPALRVPLHAAVRPASDMQAAQSTLVADGPAQQFALGLTGQGVNTGSDFPVDIQSLVSVFELQAESPAKPASASSEEQAGDLRYVGVSSDGRVRQETDGSWIYFGVALEQDWLLPTTEAGVVIWIDTDRDGTNDFRLFSARLLDGNDNLTDVMVTGLTDLSVPETAAEGYINRLSAEINTAVFDNSVMILPVQVSSLGLTTGSPRFNYQVEVLYQGVVRDSTATLTYDWLNPGLDIFFHASAPLLTYFDLPSTVLPITYNAANLQQNGSLGLMLMHHFNRQGQRIDIVTVMQSQTVTFAPNTPTSKTLGDPPFQVSATASSGLPVTISSQTPAVCTINAATNTVTLAAVGTCTLRASQAGNATFQPASVDHSIVVAAAPVTPCSPRPRVVLGTQRTGAHQIQATVTAGHGAIQTVRFGTASRPMTNGTVQIQTPGGFQPITTGTTLTMPPNTTTVTFTATRGPNLSEAMTIPMIVTDGCGAWETLVGLGRGG